MPVPPGFPICKPVCRAWPPPPYQSTSAADRRRTRAPPCAEFGVAIYELTGLGAHTGDLLFELAMFGGRFPHDQDVKRPGNLHAIAVTLRAELVVDTERFALTQGRKWVEKNVSLRVRSGSDESAGKCLTRGLSGPC